MKITDEFLEDYYFFEEAMFDDACQEYIYEGINGPIIGIHGVLYGWPEDGLRAFMKKHKVKGQLLYLGSLMYGIKQYFKQLDIAFSKYKNPLILGFSAGGFLALDYVNKNNLWKKINKIITIGTPFNGIHQLYKVAGKTAKEVVPGSPLLGRIRKINPPKDKVLSIFAKKDRFVGNPDLIEINWPKVITKAQSHGDIQNHQKWFEKILKSELGI